MRSQRIRLMDKIPFFFSMLVILSICICVSILFASPLYAQQAITLTVGDGLGNQGSSGNPVEVNLSNVATKVLGMGLDICTGDYLTCAACETTDRTTGLECTLTELGNGCCKVLLRDNTDCDEENISECESIAEGEGAIFRLIYSVSMGAPAGECRELSIQDIHLRDKDNNPLLDTKSLPGTFCVACTNNAECGDGLFCNGTETCAGGICEPGGNPCPGQVCEEDSDTCFDILPLMLTVGDGAGYRGSWHNRVGVALDNPVDKVKAIQMDICNPDDLLIFTACKGIDRAADFHCEMSEERDNGCVTLMLLSLDGAIIEKGNGPIVELTYDISRDAPEDTCRDFNLLYNMLAADVSGNPMDVTTEGGPFCFYNCSSYQDCSDGVLCNGPEPCTDGICQPSTGIDPCPPDYVCDERIDKCRSYVFCDTDEDCDDGLFCNGQEICYHARGNVQDKVVPFANCGDGSAPCPPELCDEDNDVCWECLEDAECNDGLFCNGEESCVNHSCQPGTDPCPGQMCDEKTDQCLPLPPPVAPCTISIQPASADVIPGEGVTFTVTPEGDCSLPNYEWSVDSGCGSICDQSGNYNAGLHLDMFNPAIDVVRVVDHGNDDISAEATVTVSFACPLMQIYGKQSKELEALRNFRDKVMSQTPEGQELINLYYQWSPLLEELLTHDDALKEEVRGIIDGLLPLMNSLMGMNAGTKGTHPRGGYPADHANGRFQRNDVMDVKCGDIEPSGGDGEVDIADVMAAIDIALGRGEPSDCQLKMADVTTGTPPDCQARDDQINIFDVLVIMDVVLEKAPNCCTTYLACKAECLTAGTYDGANDAAGSMKTKGCSAFEIYRVLKDIYLLDTIEAERILHQIGFPEEAYIDFTAFEWIERFAPVLMFDGSHKGLPMSAEVYFESGLLRPAVDENAGTIRWVTDWEPECNPAKGIYGQCGRDECTCGMQNNSFQTLVNGDVPTYYKVVSDIDASDEGRLRIVYWWFYGFQPACSDVKACPGNDGTHHGDWERIMVTTSPDRKKVDCVTYYQHKGYYTRKNFPLDGERPKVYVGKLAHGSYHSNDISGWMEGTPHHCCYYADFRNPKGSTTWNNTYLNLVSLRGTSESWMHADHIGSPYAYNGGEYLITGWRWGPHISYCNFGGGCCSDWEHNMACSTHPTGSQPDWTMGSCSDEGCGTNYCKGLRYSHDAHYNQGWPWD